MGISTYSDIFDIQYFLSLKLKNFKIYNIQVYKQHDLESFTTKIYLKFRDSTLTEYKIYVELDDYKLQDSIMLPVDALYDKLVNEYPEILL